MCLSEFDSEVRLAIYRYFARTGDAPSVRHTSDEIGAPPGSIVASMERLAAGHVLVLDPATRELWMAMPFSAVPTAFRVHGEGRAWWANCAWDALGISAMLQLRVEIISSCSDCGDPAPIRSSGDGVSDGSGVVHFAVPAASWWEDIGFT